MSLLQRLTALDRRLLGQPVTAETRSTKPAPWWTVGAAQATVTLVAVIVIGYFVSTGTMRTSSLLIAAAVGGSMTASSLFFGHLMHKRGDDRG